MTRTASAQPQGTRTQGTRTIPMLIGGQPAHSSMGLPGRAFRGWAETSPDARAELLFKGIELLKQKEIVRSTWAWRARFAGQQVPLPPRMGASIPTVSSSAVPSARR